MKKNLMFYTGSADTLKLDNHNRRYDVELLDPKSSTGLITTGICKRKPHLYKQNGLWRCRHYAGASYAGQTPKDAYDLMQMVVTRN